MGDAPDGLRVGARLNHHDERIKELKKKITQLEQHVGIGLDMLDLLPSNKEIRICLDGGETYIGTIVSANKYRIKMALGGGYFRTFSKGHIRWHEEL